MGNRANIVINDRLEEAPSDMMEALSGSVVMYMHGGGEDDEYYWVLYQALIRRKAWNNPSYLSRFIAESVLKSRMVGSSLGFGICAGKIMDNDSCNKVLICFPKGQKVAEYETLFPFKSGTLCQSWSFDDFCVLTENRLADAEDAEDAEEDDE